MRTLLRSLVIAIVLIAAGAVLRPWLGGIGYAIRLGTLPAPDVLPVPVAGVKPAHLPELVRLAQRLHAVFAGLARGDVDAAARGLNELLAQHPAQPHLAKEDGVWRLHHHPQDAPLVPMWAAICAEGLARVVGLPSAQRLGTCEREGCGRVFVDVSKNASRRFCSLACQNRVKAAAFRARRAART